MAWTPQPSWLANPVGLDAQHVTTNEGVARFRVSAPGRGMKWSWSLPAAVDPAPYRYAVMRYRARLANVLPPQSLSDACLWRADAAFEGFQAVLLPPAALADGSRWLQRLRLIDWPTTERVTVEGIPFQLPASPPVVAATSVQDKSQVALGADCQANEVFVLLLAKFFGPDEPVFGGGRLKAIGDVDRFRLRLRYADGTADECLPGNVSTGRFGVIEGAQVLVAAADGAKRLCEIIVCDGTRQGAFAVAAC